MHIVHVYKGEAIDRALKRLKAKMDIDDVLEEVRSRKEFETNAQKRKRKQKSLDKKRKRNR